MSDENLVPDDVIATIKAQFPHRKVKVITIEDDGESLPFLMTSPVREEWKMYRVKITAAGQNIEAIEGAIESAALAQIRYPDRESVKAIFDARPGIVQSFAEELAKLAGAQVEVTSKNA
jgi:hypothetical protein